MQLRGIPLHGCKGATTTVKSMLLKSPRTWAVQPKPVPATVKLSVCSAPLTANVCAVGQNSAQLLLSLPWPARLSCLLFSTPSHVLLDVQTVITDFGRHTLLLAAMPFGHEMRAGTCRFAYDVKCTRAMVVRTVLRAYYFKCSIDIS